MRTGKFRWAVGLVSVMVLVGVAGAQSAEPACTMGFSGFHSYGAVGRSAFSATVKSTFEQRLADGSYVRGYVMTHQARDGTGRTLSEMAQGCHRDENGVPQPWLTVNVFDPVAKISLNWQVNMPFADKVVHVFHSSPTPPKPMTAEERAAQRKRLQLQQPQASEYKHEDLGVRTIAGVEAHGSRTTQTVPPGEEGNELALVITHETWTAKDPGLVVMAMDDDPRRGRSTYEVEELTVGEPDASLFAPPAGYKILDQNPPVDSATKP